MSEELKTLAFTNLKNYFIYFNTQFQNTPCINSPIFPSSKYYSFFFIHFFSLSFTSSLPQKPKKYNKIIYIFFIPYCYYELLVLAVHCSKLPKKLQLWQLMLGIFFLEFEVLKIALQLLNTSIADQSSFIIIVNIKFIKIIRSTKQS